MAVLCYVMYKETGNGRRSYLSKKDVAALRLPSTNHEESIAKARSPDPTE